jgi:hypothetical protein
MTPFDATEHSLSDFQFPYIWTIFTAEHLLPRMVTPCNAFKRNTLYFQF